MSKDKYYNDSSNRYYAILAVSEKYPDEACFFHYKVPIEFKKKGIHYFYFYHEYDDECNEMFYQWFACNDYDYIVAMGQHYQDVIPENISEDSIEMYDEDGYYHLVEYLRKHPEIDDVDFIKSHDNSNINRNNKRNKKIKKYV